MFFFFSSRRRHTRSLCDWSSDVCSSDLPYEDMGYYIVGVQLPPGATTERTKAMVKDMEDYIQGRPATAQAEFLMGYSFSGMGQNAALAFVTLKDWSVRGAGQASWDEVQAFNQRFASLSDGTVMAVDPPPIDGLGNSGGFALRLQDRANLGREALIAARDQLLAKANASPIIAYAMMENLEDAPRSEEHTSELQSHSDLVCRLLLEKKRISNSQPW